MGPLGRLVAKTQCHTGCADCFRTCSSSTGNASPSTTSSARSVSAFGPDRNRDDRPSTSIRL